MINIKYQDILSEADAKQTIHIKCPKYFLRKIEVFQNAVVPSWLIQQTTN